MLKWAVSFTAASEILTRVFYPIFFPFCKEKKDLQERDRRTKKAAHNMYIFIYFTTMVAWGYQLLKDKPWFPGMLGGSGDFRR